MSIRLRHIALVSLLCVFVVSACSDGSRKIPKSKLADIYAEILITDQWVAENYSVKSLADTSLVYAPILEKYGYTVEDYMYSVEYYMNDSERFSRILRRTAEILDKKMTALQKRKELIDWKEKMDRLFSVDFHSEDFFPYTRELADYYDSLRVEFDTLTYSYRIFHEILNDTIYRGPSFIVRELDSLEIARRDSLARLDSLAVVIADSLARTDSIRKADSIAKLRPVYVDSLARRAVPHEDLIFVEGKQ